MEGLKMLFALSLVLALLFLMAYVLKKIGPGRLSPGGKDGLAMRIVSTLPLGERRYLLIVELAGRHFFLGVTTSSIQLLQELRDLPPLPAPPETDTSFESIMEKARTLLRGKNT